MKQQGWLKFPTIPADISLEMPVNFLKKVLPKKATDLQPEFHAGWPVGVQIPAIVSPDVFSSQGRQLNSSGHSGQTQSQFSPARLLAVGKTGELVLDELSRQPAFRQAILADVIKTACFVNKDQRKQQTHFGELFRMGSVQESLDIGPAYIREFDRSCLQNFRNWMADGELVLPRAYILASIHDPLVHILPRLLHLLNNMPGNGSVVTLLLSLGTPQGEHPLPSGDAIANLKLLTRLQVKNDIIFDALPGLGNETAIIKEQALVHFLILLGNDRQETPPHNHENTVIQALFETLFSLMHSSGEIIYQRLNNVVPVAASILNADGIPVISSCSVSTLRAPLAEIQQYVAARMTGQVLFDPVFGLVKAKSAKIWAFEDESGHPLYRWLLNLDVIGRSSHPFAIVNIHDFRNGFRMILQNSLNHFLNEDNGGVRDVLSALIGLSKQILHARSILDPLKSDSGWKKIHELTGLMNGDIQKIRNVVETWGESLFGEEFTSESKQSSEGSLGNPFLALQPQAQQHQSLKEIAENENEMKLGWLEKYSDRQYSYSVLDIKNREKLENFYNMVASEADLKALAVMTRDRFGWWGRWDDAEFKLSLVFLPENWVPGKNNMNIACYEPACSHEFYDQVFSVSQSKTVDIKEHFTSTYFDQLLIDQREKLCSVSNFPYLSYDQELFVDYEHKPHSRLGFIIGRDNVQVSNLQGRDFKVFSNIPTENITLAQGNESIRVTALGIKNYIPLAALALVKDAQNAEANHLYPNEENAQEYRPKNQQGSWLMTPVLVFTLWNIDLVRLFFRMLFLGLIYFDQDYNHGYGTTNGRWCVAPLGKFPGYTLGTGDQFDHLWDAYENFVLRFWIQPGRTPLEIRDSAVNPFLLKNRVKYLNELRDKCKTMQSEDQQIRFEFNACLNELVTSNRLLFRQFAEVLNREKNQFNREIMQHTRPFSEPFWNLRRKHG